MKVAIYTLTRDRLEYTQHCFSVLWEKAGYPFDHFIVDNGSEDGTVQWLKENERSFKEVIYNPDNFGISKASNQALDVIREAGQYDLICKMDNDCEIVFDGILERVVRIYKAKPSFKEYMLSPRVEGINHQPGRYARTMIDECEIGLTGIVGGLFHILPGHIYQQFRYNETLPKAKGQDENICNWFRNMGGECGYIEHVVINHFETTDGQCQRFKSYFERKWQEEKL